MAAMPGVHAVFTLDDLMPEACAACREAGRRAKNMRHFDVQILGGIVLHRGNIAEMVTGEGKTLVATLPAYLNALDGKGVRTIAVMSIPDDGLGEAINDRLRRAAVGRE